MPERDIEKDIEREIGSGQGLSVSSLKKKKMPSLSGKVKRAAEIKAGKSTKLMKRKGSYTRTYLVAALLLLIAFFSLNIGIIRIDAFCKESPIAALVYGLAGAFTVYLFFASAYEIIKIRQVELLLEEHTRPQHFRNLMEVTPVAGSAFLFSSGLLFTFYIYYHSSADEDAALTSFKAMTCLIPAVLVSMFLTGYWLYSRKNTPGVHKIYTKHYILLLAVLFFLYFVFLTVVFPELFRT